MNRRIYLFGIIVIFLVGMNANTPTIAQENGDDSDGRIEIISVDEKPLQEDDLVEGPVPVDRILAVVGEEVLTMGDFRGQYGDTVITYGRLEPMLDRLLLLEAARRKEISAPEDRVDQLIERQIKRFENRPGGLDRLLEARNLTRARYEKQLRRKVEKQMLESRVLANVFPQIRNSDTSPAYASVRARLLYVNDLVEAWRIYGWLQDQSTESTWNKLYQRHSRKLSLMGESGDLGWFNWGRFNQTIEYQVFKLPLYTVSRPFTLRDGYALIYPTGYRLGPTNPEASDSLKAYRNYRRRYFQEKLYERLREKYSVVIPTSVKKSLQS